MKPKDLAQNAAILSQKLGLDIQPTARLDEALTHPSASSRARPDNQRLEFLGDRVLGLIVSEKLLELFPQDDEGHLAPRFNALVRGETCAEMAGKLGLGDMLRLGRSESMSGGRRKAALQADAMEALIAAIYLDQGMEAARKLVHKLWGDRLSADVEAPVEPKSALQEWAQSRQLPPPSYDVLGRSGPDHAPRFKVRASLTDGQEATAEAENKRRAEKLAAALLLAAIKENQA